MGCFFGKEEKKVVNEEPEIARKPEDKAVVVAPEARNSGRVILASSGLVSPAAPTTRLNDSTKTIERMTAMKRETSSAEQLSRAIDKTLKEEKKKSKNVQSLLLMGCSEAGKSTLVTQIQLTFAGHKFADSDLSNYYKALVYENIFSILTQIFNGRTQLGLEWANKESQSYEKIINNHEKKNILYIEKGASISIQKIWKDDTIAKILKKSGEVFISDSVFYWFPRELQRVLQDDFIPTTLDILHCRSMTVDIKEYKFTWQDVNLRIIDVGGHRTLKNKWLQMFADSQSIIFVASIVGYCQKCKGNKLKTKMQDSLELFESVVNNQFLINIPIILFLNKIDIMPRYLDICPLESVYPDYQPPSNNTLAPPGMQQSASTESSNIANIGKDEMTSSTVATTNSQTSDTGKARNRLSSHSKNAIGSRNYQSATTYILNKYLSKTNKQPADTREVYGYFTHATDSGQMTSILTDVLQSLIKLASDECDTF